MNQLSYSPLDTGDYFVPDANLANKSGAPVTIEELEAFHYDRLQTIASNDVWSHVDLIAFETIPRLDEAIAIRRALKRLFSSFQSKLSYASFVFPQGSRLPWPRSPKKDEVEDMNELLEKVLGSDEQGRSSPLSGVGINCTKPKYLLNFVEDMTAALAHVQTHRKPYLFVSAIFFHNSHPSDFPLLDELYPDGGLVWDGIKRVWSTEEGSHSSSLSWSDQVMQAGKVSQSDDLPWAGCFVGGCCKATVGDIKALRSYLNANET